jgi:hypothetical protein
MAVEGGLAEIGVRQETTEAAVIFLGFSNRPPMTTGLVRADQAALLVEP